MPQTPMIDHVVLLVHDLDAAAARLEAAGLTVLQRADIKEKPGSRFRFVSFADGSYILLNAFSDEALKKHRLGPILSEREGWGDWSVAVADLDATIARAGAAGLPLGGENAVKNVLSTGETWGLRLLVSGRGSPGDQALPFMVQDVEGRAARIPGPSQHSGGARGIVGVTVASDDPQASARALAVLAGLPEPQETSVAVGPARIDFVPTDPAGTGTARLGGPVAVRLATAAGTTYLAEWPFD